jgi:predicted nucleic-acid-binding protein
MIGIDTNILARLIVRDDSVQAAKAATVLTEKCSGKNPGFINCIVLAEVFLILSRVYKYSRKEIARAIEKLLQVKEIQVQNADEVCEALNTYQTTRIDFFRCLLERHQQGKWLCRDNYF